MLFKLILITTLLLANCAQSGQEEQQDSQAHNGQVQRELENPSPFPAAYWEVDSSFYPYMKSFEMTDDRAIIVQRGYSNLVCIDRNTHQYLGTCYADFPVARRVHFQNGNSGDQKSSDSVEAVLIGRHVHYEDDSLFMLRNSQQGPYAELGIYDLNNQTIVNKKIQFPDSIRSIERDKKPYILSLPDPGFVKINNYIYFVVRNLRFKYDLAVWRFNYHTGEMAPIPQIYNIDQYTARFLQRLRRERKHPIENYLRRLYLAKYEDELVIAPATSPYCYRYKPKNKRFTRIKLGDEAVATGLTAENGHHYHQSYRNVLYDEKSGKLSRFYMNGKIEGDSVYYHRTLFMRGHDEEKTNSMTFTSLTTAPNGYYFLKDTLCLIDPSFVTGLWAAYKVPYEAFKRIDTVARKTAENSIKVTTFNASDKAVGSPAWFEEQIERFPLCQAEGVTLIRFKKTEGFCPSCASTTGHWIGELTDSSATNHAYLLALENFENISYHSFLNRTNTKHLPHAKVPESGKQGAFAQYSDHPMLLIHYNGSDTTVVGYDSKELQKGLDHLKQWPSSCQP